MTTTIAGYLDILLLKNEEDFLKVEEIRNKKN